MRKVNNYLGVVLILVWGLAPFYWMVITALRDKAYTFSTNPLPSHLTMDNFRDALATDSGNDFLRAIGNSLFISFATTLIALAVFLVIVFVYIAVRFDREMSIAAMGSLFFDLIVTAGIYSLVGWEVTPATVIGLLTILGFSIYDTVVVFDKISENTRSVLQTTRRTYAEQANLGVNQTLMRSINTTVISVLPIIALMVIAVWLLGVGTLKDLGLIQLVGVLVGTFSSVFLAAPLLATLKERRPDIGRHTEKVLRRRAGLPSDEPRPVRTRRGASAGAAVDTDDADRAVPTGKRRRNR